MDKELLDLLNYVRSELKGHSHNKLTKRIDPNIIKLLSRIVKVLEKKV